MSDSQWLIDNNKIGSGSMKRNYSGSKAVAIVLEINWGGGWVGSIDVRWS